jgi:hypothetical protein
VQTDRFLALRSHYLYESQFTIPGVEGAHEKGDVEGEAGRFRRRHLVPVPEGLHARGVERADARRVQGGSRTTDRWALGDRRLGIREGAPVAARAASREGIHGGAGHTSGERQDTGHDQAEQLLGPVRLAGLRVHSQVGAREIELRHGGERVALHERLQGRFGVSASLDHYLELLARKPGALAGSVALSQERERGAWPSIFDELWAKIAERYGPSEAARQMVDVLMLARGPRTQPHQERRRLTPHVRAAPAVSRSATPYGLRSTRHRRKSQSEKINNTQQPTRSGATSSRRAGASANRRA